MVPEVGTNEYAWDCGNYGWLHGTNMVDNIVADNEVDVYLIDEVIILPVMENWKKMNKAGNFIKGIYGDDWVSMVDFGSGVKIKFPDTVMGRVDGVVLISNYTW